jgi:hypothetical protein
MLYERSQILRNYSRAKISFCFYIFIADFPTLSREFL